MSSSASSTKKLINVIAPDGSTGTIPSENIDAAIANGFTVETQQQTEDRLLRKEYGTSLVDELRAGAEGVARGLTFGVSDAAMKALGVDTKGIAARQKYNPTAAMTGEIGGAAAGLFLPIGLAGAGVKGAAALGKAAETGVLASKVLGKAAPVAAKIAGGAAEGLPYALGSALSEKVLRDPEMSAEQIMSHVGLNTVLAGGIPAALYGTGALLKMTGGVAGKAYEASKTAIKSKYRAKIDSSATAAAKGKSVVDALADASASTSANAAQEAQTVVEITTQQPSIFSTKNQEALKALAEAADERSTIKQQFADAAQMGIDETEALSKSAGKINRKKILEEASRVPVQQAKDGISDFVYTTMQRLEDMKSRPDKFNRGFVRDFDIKFTGGDEGTQYGLLYDIDNATDSGVLYKHLDDFKKDIDSLMEFDNANFKNLPREERLAVEELRATRAELKALLEDKQLWGEAGSRQARYNNAVSDYISSYKNLMSTFGGSKKFRRGGTEKKISPVKINTYFNQITDARSADKLEALNDFLETQKQFLDAVDNLDIQDSRIANIRQSSQDMQQIHTRAAELYGDAAKMRAGGYLPLVAEFGSAAAFVPGAQAAMSQAGNVVKVYNKLKQVADVKGALKAAAEAKGLAFASADAKAKARAALALNNAIVEAGNAADTALRKIFSAPVDAAAYAAQKAQSLRGPISFQLMQGEAKAREAKRAEERINKDNFQAQVDKLNAIVTNPEAVLKKMEASLEAFGPEMAPVAQHVATKSMTVANFILSKAPRNPHNDMVGLVNNRWVPSDSQLAKYQRYIDAATKPQTVFEDLRNGRVSVEAVEALKACWPKHYQMAQNKIIDIMSDPANESDIKKMPYNMRKQLSLLLGASFDGTMNPTYIKTTQQLYATQGDGNGGLASSRAPANNIATQLKKSSQTRTQKLEAIASGGD